VLNHYRKISFYRTARTRTGLEDTARNTPSQSRYKHTGSEEGVALLIVVFIVALCSILVVNLTQSSYREGRINNAAAKRIQAEYLLKSTINFARVLISNDESPETDAPADKWATFAKGQAIPVPEAMGINVPGLNIEIEIQPEDQKFPIRALLTGPGAGGQVDIKWRDACVRLFRQLGFDDDLNEVDHTKTFPGKHFTSAELVALLIDYMDFDNDTYDPGDFPAGIEGDLPPNTFSNSQLKRIGELQTIPGFTPARLRKLFPFITVFENNKVNVNFASPILLKAISEDIDDSTVAAIDQFRNSEDGFTPQNLSTEMAAIIGQEGYDQIASMLKVGSSWFQIIAKVYYGETTYFMRAYVSEGGSGGGDGLPVIRSVELF